MGSEVPLSRYAKALWGGSTAATLMFLRSVLGPQPAVIDVLFVLIAYSFVAGIVWQVPNRED